jgi:ABC-type polar amino acid transport system ATPase subunit
MITITDLHKRHGRHQILRGVTAQVATGEVVAVVGPSGAGKSTLLRCLNYLEPFDRGEVVIAGHTLRPGMGRRQSAALGALRAGVGMVFQQFNLFPHLTALGNITLAPIVAGGQAPAAAAKSAEALLVRVGLGGLGGRYPAELSGGQQQRVAIARALARQPQVMLFDEPTSALDPAMRNEVLEVIRGLARGGMTMLVVSHDEAVPREIATRVWTMTAGTISDDRRGPARPMV